MLKAASLFVGGLGPESTAQVLAEAMHCFHEESYADALPLFEAVVEADSTSHTALFHIGWILMWQDEVAESIRFLRDAVALAPRMSRYRIQLGMALRELRQPVEALECFDAALTSTPDSLQGLLRRAETLVQLGRLQEAVAAYEKVFESTPDSVEAHAGRSFVLNKLGRWADAFEGISIAVALRPRSSEFHALRAAVAERLNLYDESLAAADRALAIDPANQIAHFCRAYALLLRQDFGRGFEAMAGMAGQHFWHIDCPEKRWDGTQSLDGKTLVIDTEHGYGDQIQFSRYALVATAAGAKVVFRVAPGLKELLASIPDMGQIIDIAEIPPPFDLHCPLMALPGNFKTSLESIPHPGKYLHSNPELRDHWEARLGPRRALRVGLVWSGNPIHANDANRSMTLSTLLSNLPSGPHYVSLHQEVRSCDSESLAEHPEVTHFGEELRSFSDTAALCDCLDVVVTVDSGVAHLAAGLGKRTWIMLPFYPEWRWLERRSDSPWYETVKLFRQRLPRNWSHVMASVGANLRELMNDC